MTSIRSFVEIGEGTLGYEVKSRLPELPRASGEMVSQGHWTLCAHIHLNLGLRWRFW